MQKELIYRIQVIECNKIKYIPQYAETYNSVGVLFEKHQLKWKNIIFNHNRLDYSISLNDAKEQIDIFATEQREIYRTESGFYVTENIEYIPKSAI